MLNFTQFHRPGIRVAIFCRSLGAGGAERWLAALVKHAIGFRYTGICLWRGMHSHPHDELKYEFNGIPIYLAQDHNLEEQMINTLRHGADMVLTWGCPEPTAALREANIPIVQVSHCSFEDTESGWSPQGWRINADDPIGHFISAVSRSSAVYYPPHIREKEKVTVIHNGVDIERTVPRYGRAWQLNQWGLSQNTKVLLYVGRFSVEKNAEAVVNCAKLLPDGWSIVCYGWGVKDHDLRMLAKSNLCEVPVLFPQPRTGDLGDVYAASNAVVIPSFVEAFPIVMLEAWMAGKPVIASSFATLDELEEVYSGGKPLVWRTSRPSKAEQIARLAPIADKTGSEVIARARAIAFDNFTANAMVGRWESYLFRCLQEWQTASLTGRTYCPGRKSAPLPELFQSKNSENQPATNLAVREFETDDEDNVLIGS